METIYREFDKTLDYDDGTYIIQYGAKRIVGDFRTIFSKLCHLRSEAISNSHLKCTYRLYTDPMGEERKRREARREAAVWDRFTRELVAHSAWERGRNEETNEG